MPAGKPLIVASYIGGDIPTAYVESVGIGDPLPPMPIFLSDIRYIPAPLEPTYLEAWAVFPAMLKRTQSRSNCNRIVGIFASRAMRLGYYTILELLVAYERRSLHRMAALVVVDTGLTGRIPVSQFRDQT